MALHTWYYIHGITYMALHTWYYIHGITYMALHTWYYIHGITYMALHTWHYIHGITYMVLHTWKRNVNNCTLSESALSALVLTYPSIVSQPVYRELVDCMFYCKKIQLTTVGPPLSDEFDKGDDIMHVVSGR